jgi:hypothetical protein
MVDSVQQDSSHGDGRPSAGEHPKAVALRHYYRWMILLLVLMAAGVGAAAQAFEAFLVAFGISAATLAVYSYAVAGSVLVPSRANPTRLQRAIVGLLLVGAGLELASLVLALAHLSGGVPAVAGLVVVTAAASVGARLLTR